MITDMITSFFATL